MLRGIEEILGAPTRYILADAVGLLALVALLLGALYLPLIF